MRRTRFRQGSITIWLALFLGILMPLILAGLVSVRTASDRVQILDGVQTGLYSLFGQYDRACFRKYGILVLDTGCGSESPNLPAILDIFRKYCDPVLEENGRNIHVTGGGFSGYRTVAENHGEAFHQQAVRYMEKCREAGKLKAFAGKEDIAARERILACAASGVKFESEDHQIPAEFAGIIEQTGPRMFDGTTDQAVYAILEGREVSEKTMTGEGDPLRGTLSPGTPVYDGFTADTSDGAETLFRCYIADKLGNFRKPSRGGLDYELEYALFGYLSDRENLAALVREFLLFREGENSQKLMEDAGKLTEIGLETENLFRKQTESELLSSGMQDEKSSFSGEAFEAVKRHLVWLEVRKKSVEDTMQFLNGKDVAGMKYEDFARILACSTARELLVERTMKMEELNIRETERKEFCFGNCIAALEVFLDVDADGRTFHVSRSFCYD